MPQINPDLRVFLASRETAESLAQIAQKYNFNKEQKILQAKIAGLLVLGKIKPEELESRVKKHLSLDAEKSREVAQQIKENIFLKAQALARQEKKEETIVLDKPKIENTDQTASQNLNTHLNNKELPNSIQAGFQINDFIKSFPWQLSDLQLKRLKSAVLIYLKDVRDSRQTYSVLSRSIEEGGIGLNEEQAKTVLKKLKAVKQEKEYFAERTQEIKTKIFQKKVNNEASIFDQTESMSKKAEPAQTQKEVKQTEKAPAEPVKEKVEEVKPIQKPASAPVPHLKPVPRVVPKVVPRIVDVVKPKQKEIAVSLEKMEDLAKLNLSFLRTKEAELKEKLDRFMQENAEQAEELFKQSPLYNLYKDSVETAMQRGLTLADLAEERKRQGADWMSLAEIEAIAEMVKE